MVVYRTDLVAFVLDQLDFIEEKLREACADPASQKAAVTEASGAVPQLRDRLRAEDEPKATLCMFAFRALVDRNAFDWWAKLAKMERKEFLEECAPLLDTDTGAIAAVRAVVVAKA